MGEEKKINKKWAILEKDPETSKIHIKFSDGTRSSDTMRTPKEIEDCITKYLESGKLRQEEADRLREVSAEAKKLANFIWSMKDILGEPVCVVSIAHPPASQPKKSHPFNN